MAQNVKSEQIYRLMKTYVEQGLAEKAVKKCNASYQIQLLDKPKGKVVFSFWIAVKKDEQKVETGVKDKADATFTMTDDDFFKMCNGKLNPQMAFIRRKMKIKGNFKKATAFTPDLFPKPTKENIEKYLSGKPKL